MKQLNFMRNQLSSDTARNYLYNTFYKGNFPFSTEDLMGSHEHRFFELLKKELENVTIT